MKNIALAIIAVGFYVGAVYYRHAGGRRTDAGAIIIALIAVIIIFTSKT
jgi:putative Mn2+ efflux pump MntP